MNENAPELRRLLAQLRGRVRRTWTQRGLGLVIAAACVAAVVSFVLDYTLDLPLAVRVLHLLAIGIFLAIVAWRTIAKPLRIPLGDEDLAQAVEHGKPEFRDRLISALNFERRLADPDEPESRELMAQVVSEARTLAASTGTADLIDARAARRALALGVGGLVLLLAVAATAGDAFGMWLRRGVLLEDVSWPRRTHIRVAGFPEDRPLVVTRGDDVRIVAEVLGDIPRELSLHYEELADGSTFDDPEIVFSDVRTLYPSESDERRFARDLRSVSASFRFWVTGGDDDDDRPLYSVHTVIPPRIASVSAAITYPGYSGLAPETRDLPNLSVLEGSRVEYTLVTNMPLASARLVPLRIGPDDEAPQDQAPTELVVQGEQSDTLQIELTVVRTQRFHLELVAAEGHVNRSEDDVFHLIATRDRAPRIQIHYPDTRKFRTPEGLIPLKARISDDFGLLSVRLDVTRGSGAVISLPIWPTEIPGPGRNREIPVYVPIDFVTLHTAGAERTMPILPSELVHLVLRAEDNTGQESESGEMTIEILTREAQQKRLAEEQTRLRSMLIRLHGNQQRIRDDVRRLFDRLRDEPADSAALDAARRAQVDQGRITNELTQFLRAMQRVLDAYTLNRLGNVPTLERMLPVYDEFLSRPTDSADGVFPPALYAKLLAEKRAERLFDPDVLGAVLDILDLSDQAVESLSPSVYAALLEWGRDQRHPRDVLQTALERADELDALLTRLEERMQRWEHLNEIIEILSGLANTEDELSKEVPVKAGTDEEGR